MKKVYKLISILLCMIMAFSVCACNLPAGDSSNPETPPAQEQTPGSGNEENNPGANNGTEEPGSTFFSYDHEDYVGDLETFVYGLLITKLEYIYDVFPAYIQLSNGYFVYGLAYTDYSECYTSEDEKVAYFMSGFLPFVGELEIPQEDFDSGLYLYNLDYQDEETFFVWKYKSEAFLEHCVVYGAYLQYGVDTSGQITYNAIPFEREKCDISLGSLYSYDDSRYLYDVDFGDYMPINGISLAETFDYEEFEKEVNAFIEEQNANWYSFDVETVAYNSQNAVEAYLLSLQEETFLGYPVEQLVELSQELDPLQCFRITPEGLSVIDIEEIPPEGASALVKWLVGGACAIVAAVGIVGSIVFSACPPLSALAGAVTGAAIETFMQVIIENKTLENVQWSKVGIAALSGAVSGFLGPYLQTLGGATYFFVDSAVDGLIGGIEQAVFAMMDGADGEEILERFGRGFVLGAGISAGFKVAGKVLSKVGQGLSTGAQKIAKKLPAKLTKALSKFTKPIKDIGASIGDGIGKLKQKADSSIFHSKFISQRQFNKQLTNLLKTDSDKLAKKSIFDKGSLKVDNMLDPSGAPISKNQLYDSFLAAKDGEVIGKYVVGDEVVCIWKKNGVASVLFDDKYESVVLKYGITPNRTNNLIEASEIFRKKWIEDSSTMPKELMDDILKEFPDKPIEKTLEDLTSYKMFKIIENSSYVLHENIDLITVSLVPNILHTSRFGGVSHMGGRALAEYIRVHMGSFYFETFVSAAASGVVIGGMHG